MTAAGRTKVLFIGGEGRSGSTVLERLLATNPDTFAVGEGRYLLERGIGNRELCGCGEPAPDCEFWSEVGTQLLGGWDSPDGRELVQFFTMVNHRSKLPVILSGHGAMVKRAREFLSELYPLIAKLSGSQVIIDSSKHPSWAYLLASTESVDLRVAHLVRHPSAVVQSWSRPVVRPQAGSGEGERMMPAHSPLEVVIRWNLFNRLFHRLAHRSVPTVLVRYEDYPEDVEETLRACIGMVGLRYAPRPITMKSGHGIAGNPSRFADDGEKIVVDERWVTEMSSIKHAVVCAMTRRVRGAYGYRFNRGEPVRPMLRHVHGPLAPSPVPVPSLM
jgi:hypothetical protein